MRGVQRGAELVDLKAADLNDLGFLGNQLSQLGVLLEHVGHGAPGRAGPPGVGDVGQRGGLPPGPEAGGVGARVCLRLRVQAAERRPWLGGEAEA